MSRRGSYDAGGGAPRWGVPRWVDQPEPPDDWDNAGVVGGSTRAQAALSTALRYALWTGIALALVLGLVNCAAPSGSGPPAATGSDPVPVPPPGGCAELVVAAWLAGDTDLLADVPGLGRGQVEPGRRQAVATYTATVTPGEVGWGYVIGAEVQERDEDDERWVGAGHQFFSVTMIPTVGGCQGWAPAALPARVSGPALGGAQDAYPVTLPASGTELSETLQGFFSGMLAGDGDPERYVAPGTEAPVLDPPYPEASVVELRTITDPPVDRATQVAPEGTVMPVLVTVATHPDDLPLVYPLTVGVRGGRWEVLAIEALVGTSTASTPQTSAGTTPAATNGG